MNFLFVPAHVKIPLYGKYGDGKFAFISPEDLELVSQYKWHISTRGYPVRGKVIDGKFHYIYLHRVIMPSPPEGKTVDHIDGNVLNSCRWNLRYASQTEQCINQCIRKNNTSGVKGVCWYKQRGKWNAYIDFNCKRIHLGYYDTIEEAAAARQVAVDHYHGDFQRDEGLIRQQVPPLIPVKLNIIRPDSPISPTGSPPSSP